VLAFIEPAAQQRRHGIVVGAILPGERLDALELLDGCMNAPSSAAISGSAIARTDAPARSAATPATRSASSLAASGAQAIPA